MSEMKVNLKGLTCANCAGKIENVLAKMAETEEVSINLMKQEMTLRYKEGVSEKQMHDAIEKTVHTFEPDVEVLFGEKATVPTVNSCCCGCHGEHHEHDHGCGCGHDHEHGNEEVFGKAFFLRFGFGLVLFLAAIFWQEGFLKTMLFLGAYVVFGYDVLLRAVKNIARGQVFDENFLMSVSTIGALAIGEMAEAVFVMLFYQVGEAFQDYAVARSRKSITALLDIRPDFARLVKNGETKEVAPELICVGESILVKAGERIPLDGIIEEGHAMLDTAALTGESLPRNAETGDHVLSGCINMDGNLKIRVEKPFGESTVMKILEMVENAAGKKSKTEKFITRFARVYTPVVCLLAVLVAVLPPVMGFGAFSMWFGRALVFLVVSCPCALVLSIPLGYFAGIGAASSRGVLVKGGEDLDTLCLLEQVVFDKTGTLTKGKFSVTEVEGDVLRMAAIGEAMSNHPIANAIMEAYEGELPAAENYQELGGYGISYTMDGETVLLGNSRLMERENISYEKTEGIGTLVYVAKNGKFLGHILVADTLKENIGDSLSVLKAQGVKQMVMLTGDRKETAEAVAKELHLDAVYSELLPEQKVEWMEKLKQNGLKTAFVGDGINDAPVLAGADLGVAMGGIGSDAAIEAADVVLMDDDIGKLAVGMKIAKNTRKIVNQNIAFALGFKILVLILSIPGIATMWMAVFADVGVCVLAILNSMRKKD
ncbi:MAG: cadmium-translocating P-type ATPase [Anaerotignum sp.]|nr:cadmium-translocating P-type ATPase [Anaerotignum sp.]